MIQILEYISQNYTLFFIVLVLILLAVIGYYADKTNFGQGKNKDKEQKEIIQSEKINDILQTEKEQPILENIEISNKDQSIVGNVENLQQDQLIVENTENLQQDQLIVENTENLQQDQNNQLVEQLQMIIENKNVPILINEELSNDSFNTENSDEKHDFEYSKISKEEHVDLFDEEINSLLPKKELINNDLLNEIEGMGFNLQKERTSFDVPNFNNISLPKIKNLTEKEQDIWKL